MGNRDEMGERKRLVVLRLIVNQVPSGKQWRFNSFLSHFCPISQEAKTLPFHGGNGSSILPSGALCVKSGSSPQTVRSQRYACMAQYHTENSAGKPTGAYIWRACVSHAKDHYCNDAYDSTTGSATVKHRG